MDLASQAHIDKFNDETRKVVRRVTAYLHECIGKGLDVEHPGATVALPLSPYELGFVLEVLEDHLRREERQKIEESFFEKLPAKRWGTFTDTELRIIASGLPRAHLDEGSWTDGPDRRAFAAMYGQIQSELDRRMQKDPAPKQPERDPRWRQENPRDELVAIWQGIQGHLLNIMDGTVTGDKVIGSAVHAYGLLRQIFRLGHLYLPESWGGPTPKGFYCGGPREEIVSFGNEALRHLSTIMDGTVAGGKAQNAAAHVFELGKQVMTLGRDYMPDSWTREVT